MIHGLQISFLLFVCAQETLRLIQEPGTDDCSPVLVTLDASVLTSVIMVQYPGSLFGHALTTPGFLTSLCRGLLKHHMKVSVTAAVYTAQLVVILGTSLLTGGHFLLEMLLPLDYPIASPMVSCASVIPSYIKFC